MADNSSFTIREWCAHRKVSRSKFYELDDEGKAPRTHSVGAKRLISPKADRDWLRDREREAEAAARAAAKAPQTWAERIASDPTTT
jgi:hypothetical protein